jgi:tetratricopeptide (TPR) repeat protein
MPEYTFKHALVQDAAYGTLLRRRRQQLHTHIAATLEDRFPEIVGAQPALLAHHCEEAGLTEKAIDYWLTAGRRAWGGAMVAEAVALLRRGLAQVPGFPDSGWRREREFDLQIALGQALCAFQGWGAPEASEAYARAQRLAVAVNRPRDLLLALHGQYMYYLVEADLTRARQLASLVLELGEATGDVAVLACGYYTRGYIHMVCGNFNEARADHEQALALFDPGRWPFYAELSVDPLVALLASSCQLLVCMGHLDQALSPRHRALQEARQRSRPDVLANAMANAWPAAWFIRSNPESLLQDADEYLAFSTEHGLGLHQALGRIYRGWSLAAMGHADEGLAAIGTGLAGCNETGIMLWRPLFLTLLADACRIAGQLQAALGHLGEAQRLVDETGERWTLAEALRLRGDVLLAMGDRAGAEAGYHEAIAIAQQQSARLWELRASISLARLWRDQGKRMEARDLLTPVYGWFTEGFGTPVLQDAKALLEELAP